MVQDIHNMVENNENMLDMKQLPPGFRFDPTDEELVLHFLYSKLQRSPSLNYPPNNSNNPRLIPELEDFFHHYHPCQLHGEAFESCGQWYFYTKKTENRISENGYWEELVGMNQHIFARNSNKLVGLKKYLVFYDKGAFPSTGVKTGWFMQEYHACNNNLGVEVHSKRRRSKQPDVNKWVLCRVQQLCDDSQWMNTVYEDKYNNEVELSSSDEAVFLAMEDNDQDEISYPY